jgi:hypothetical protein
MNVSLRVGSFECRRLIANRAGLQKLLAQLSSASEVFTLPEFRAVPDTLCCDQDRRTALVYEHSATARENSVVDQQLRL